MARHDVTRDPAQSLEVLIRKARTGSRDALGQLLESCRAYLLLVANEEVRAPLQAKFAPSDLVQDTFLEAQRDFGEFRGCSRSELAGWLRSILLHNVANQNRKFLGTEKRQVQRETSFDTGQRETSHGRQFTCDQQSPRGLAAAHEEAKKLEAALVRLPETYQTVIRLRHEENRSFVEIGQLLGRSAEATRKLWFRAIERLRVELGQAHAER